MPYPAGQEPRINGQRLPLKLEDAGDYRFLRSQTEARTGQGLLIVAGAPRVVWTWTYVTKSDFDSLLKLAGFDTASPNRNAMSALIGSCKLWDDTMSVLTSYNGAVMDRPVYERYQNGLFHNVTLQISELRQ